ncbi:MAG: signal peptidase I, partial [Planctomycetota bacterium]
GSMAPTLMGAHKDITCEECGHKFQIGASEERRGTRQSVAVVGGICPNCRHLNSLDLANDANHATFNGDRILVSKSAYVLSDPERWDVIVFKFPGNPKQNYIKRLVGLPNETLTVRHGDVYARPLGAAPADNKILRKPPHKLLAMQHHVYDTDQQSTSLIAANYPTRLQPWKENTEAPPTDSWKITRNEEGVVAKIGGGKDQLQWLRYFHRFPTNTEWGVAQNGGKLDNVDPYRCRAITDYYGYDCYIKVPSTDVYATAPYNNVWGWPPFEQGYDSGGPISQFRGRLRFGKDDVGDDGMHWVGDLIVATEIELADDSSELVLELVECGIQYQCRVDTKTGEAKLVIVDGDQKLSFEGANGRPPTAKTSIRAGGSFDLRFSNCDDQLLLWVDDSVVEFDSPTTFDTDDFRSDSEQRAHFKTGIHPLDGAPIGIATRGGATIDRLKVSRDKYYCATNSTYSGIYDYKMPRQFGLNPTDQKRVQDGLSRPNLWADWEWWDRRRTVSFDLNEDQFFPMGDNSPESLDARCWIGAKRGARLPSRFKETAFQYADAAYVPRNLLVGKALLVFWPHHWRSPVWHPNVSRIRLIH